MRRNKVTSRAIRYVYALYACAAFCLIASCRSPLFQSGGAVDLSLSFSIPDFYRGPGPGARAPSVGGSSRLLLPNATTLTVSLTPDDTSVAAPSPMSVALVPGEASVVRFESVAVGAYTVRAFASDASGVVVFERASTVDVSLSANSLSLTLVPAAPAGEPFPALEPGAEISGSLEPGASATWTIPAGSSKAFVALMASAGLRLFCQDHDGADMDADPGHHRAIGAAGTEGTGFATIYNAGDAAEDYELVLDDAPIVAQWKFDAGTNDYEDAVSGLVATVSGDAENIGISPGGYRSSGALSQWYESYITLAESPRAELAPPWSVLAWVYPGDSETTAPLIAGSSDNAICVNAPYGAEYVAAIRMGGITYPFSRAPATHADWVHVAVVNDGSSIRLYVNGERDPVEITDPSAVSMRLPLSTIAADGAGAFFVGHIDDLRVYQDALGPDELSEVLASVPHALYLESGAHGSISADPQKDYFETGETVTLTAVPDDATWQFDAWTGDASGSSSPITIQIDGDTTIGASFSTAVPRYSLKYDTNGGYYDGTGYYGTSTPTDEYDILFGETRSVHSSGCTVTQTADPTKYFTGWNTRADGLGAHYLPGASIVVNEDTTLFADWRIDDAPGFDDKEAATVIDITSVTTPVYTSGYSQFYPASDGAGKDVDFFKIIVPAGVSGTVQLTLEGAWPALFSATICDEDLSGYSGTGWNTDGSYVPATKSITGGTTYYIYVTHQNQAYHSGPIRTGSYNVITTFTP